MDRPADARSSASTLRFPADPGKAGATDVLALCSLKPTGGIGSILVAW
jgi:hypothetical protein